MLQLAPQSIIFVATCHVDFRKGIDGLVAFCKNNLFINPLNGSVFLFYNKNRTTIKILAYDGQGIILFIKRLSTGRFKANPLKDFSSRKSFPSNNYDNCIQICYRLVQVLINNGDQTTIKFSKDWRPVS